MFRSRTFAGVALALTLGGCATVAPNHEESSVMVGPAPRLNTTPMAAALACMKQNRGRDLRIGVSDFVDGTGIMEGGSQNSRALSQRPDMMLVVALAAAGAHLVNRSSVNVAEWELNKAMEKKLGDGRSTLVDNQRVPFRPIKAGVLLGSTHYVTGAITELNWNIDSGVAEAGAFSVSLGKRTYRISIAVDVVVTDTQTTEIVHAKSYKKQLVGFETNANLFRFMNRSSALKVLALGNAASAATTQALELFQANLGEKQNEPTQTALRWVIELAAYDMMRDLRGKGAECDHLIPGEGLDEDPYLATQANLKGTSPGALLRSGDVAQAAPAPVAPAPVVYAESPAPVAPQAPAPAAHAPAPSRVATAERPARSPEPPAPEPKREVAAAKPAPVAPVRQSRQTPVVAAKPVQRVAQRTQVARRDAPAPSANTPARASESAAKSATDDKASANSSRWMSGGVRALGTELSSGAKWAEFVQ